VPISFSRRRITQLALFLGMILLFSTISFIAANAAFLVNDQIYQGVVIDDIPVGGFSQQAARDKIETILRDRLAHKPITLTEEQQSYSIRSEDINLQFDSTELVKQAYEVGRIGNGFTQLKERYSTINYGHIIPLNLSYDHDKLALLIKTMAQSIDKEANNATIAPHGAKLSIIPEVIGKKVAVDQTIAAVESELTMHSSFIMPLIVEILKPNVFATDLREINSLIASYTTQFSSSDANRSENILIAASHIDGMLVKPNDIFSFNDSVGSRLEKFGYKEAPVFIDGKLVPDFGGGVCQVSSTLYNAALLADMTIVERNSHFSPPGYVPLGQDATVADNLLDFRFQNTSPTAIYIISEVSGNQLSIYIYGTQNSNSPDIQIMAADKKVIEPTTIVKQDPALEFGKEVVETSGQKGYQVTTYRIKSISGHEISREMLAADEFTPSNRIIRVGTKAPGNQLTK
jgi:vancomycin resistance protein YoaR